MRGGGPVVLTRSSKTDSARSPAILLSSRAQHSPWGFGLNHLKQSLPALLIITSKTDSLGLDYSYTQTNGKIVANKGDLRIYNEGTNLQLDGIEYVIVAVRREGPRLTIIAERDGTDNNKEATIRQTFIIGPGILNITKEVKYETQEKFFVRTYMRLRK